MEKKNMIPNVRRRLNINSPSYLHESHSMETNPNGIVKLKLSVLKHKGTFTAKSRSPEAHNSSTQRSPCPPPTPSITKQIFKKHTTPGIRWSSPTQLLIRPSLAYLWESGRDPEFSSGYGRMWEI
ncbi:hypothetical protein BDP55DRAFT_203570 [Colletotrichum godetiae]|uniref:Uncharacterized protein n=1 Tax=Colletotrichum godetiae TaxID=1209918 RepID=A0AAJ0AY94_9PEZI|nr:uncharacterized protein BDP55DRAFT_203570 [Colletotrichum godetiae]KAK1699695.1 hypothetical protein BDP55DRAFT_203570 [Colletotrichum godetiae]